MASLLVAGMVAPVATTTKVADALLPPMIMPMAMLMTRLLN
jgi:hypothetical protein